MKKGMLARSLFLVVGLMFCFVWVCGGVTASSCSATGGTITQSGGYCIHAFTSSGTFTPLGGSLNCEVLVVAGGGGGGGNSDGNAGRGGGGAGGLIYSSAYAVSAQAYSVIVGGGGAGGVNSASGQTGSNSVFNTLTAMGGGGGGNLYANGLNGGSGGGGGFEGYAGGSGTAGQGNAGGSGDYFGALGCAGGGGGGGAGTEGGSAAVGCYSGAGGNGLKYSISGTSTWYAGGGGGSDSSYGGSPPGAGGIGGGGAGTGVAGTANTGGGGGGGQNGHNGGAGGSGVVIVRYLIDTTNPSVSANGNSDTWYNSQRTATVSASDTGGSGLAEFRYNWGSNAMNGACTTGGTITINAASLNAPAGGTNLYLCARDGAGNTATWNGVYNWENPQSCSGTAPTGGNLVQGPTTYTYGYTPTSWTYNVSATTSTPCQWKCTSGVQSGNTCIPAVGITGAYWANLNGTQVSSANINDTLLMIISGIGLRDKTINYSIYYKESWFSWMSLINTESTIGFSSYKPEDSGSYRFKAITENVPEKTSDVLIIQGDQIGEDPQNNFLPVAIITTPVNELNISAGININFNQASYDEDDLLKITWDFGDGTKKIITNYVNNPALIGNPNYNTSANVTYTYSSSGKYVVRLTAEEMTRGQSSESVIFINVFNLGINVIPIISNPEEGKIYENKTISFNASSSYVVNCSTNCPSCPLKIENGKLNCSYLHPSSGIRAYNLFLRWTIEPDEDIIFPSGNWFNSFTGSDINTSVINFYHYFFTPRERIVKLFIEYIPSP